MQQPDWETLARAAAQARGLAIDAVHACSSGHLGLALGCAEIGAVLYGHALRHDPSAPGWINRDRLVLSAGHGSMWLYAWLHLSGYDLPLDELRNFRKAGSRTPGHPEFGATPGVEATTGPLGQGIGNAVGMAIAAKMAAARFNTPTHAIFDHRIVCLAGDGCIQEGVAAEASALAAHLRLDNLILIYDSNAVTLDAPAAVTQSEDTAARYRAYGFEVREVDGHDMRAFLDVFEAARDSGSGRPQLIIARTIIARGIPEVEGTAKGHGEGGAKHAEAARRGLGLPPDTFHVSADVREFFQEQRDALARARAEWEDRFRAWQAEDPARARLLADGLARRVPADLAARIPEFDPGEKIATRKAGGIVVQTLAEADPLLVSGSADLHGSTLNYLRGSTDFSAADRAGRNLRFGIREHAMGAILNGIAYHGIFRPSGATFLVFSDYLRPSVRLAALARLPVIYLFTHDSVGVGEDGPTHQPVEMVSALRLVPGLDVIRPADPEETAGAFAAALARTDGPVAIVMTRQTVPMLGAIPAADRREGAARGGYIARRETGPLEAIVLASGSELQHALEAAERVGGGIRVVSMPSFERFDRQPAEYREGVLPASCRRRVAIEAGVTGLWWKYVGLDGAVVGIDRFGLSAPGGEAMRALGVEAGSIERALRTRG